MHAGGQRFDPAILHHIDYKEVSADTKWFQTAFCSPCFVVLWDYSSAGKSAPLIRVRSEVQVPLVPPLDKVNPLRFEIVKI